MASVTRRELLDTLDNQWAGYADRFHRLPPEGQAAFLKKQGYARFADLLAHVVCWWEDGQEQVTKMVADAGYKDPEYDVDEFNAKAVRRYQSADEAAVLAEFRRRMSAWKNMIGKLPDEAFARENVAGRLHIEIIGHYTEHELVAKT